jgi:hypothetical protein
MLEAHHLVDGVKPELNFLMVQERGHQPPFELALTKHSLAVINVMKQGSLQFAGV